MTIIPTEIKRHGTEGIEITWSNGTSSKISSEMLRRNCPCASCKEERGDTSHQSPLSPQKGMLKIIESSKAEQIHLEKIWQVGQYALGMKWGDQHQTGIYTFAYLYELGQKQ